MKPSRQISRQAAIPGYPGFTLIELLVVIAIIAILAGLLFPVIAAIREHMRKVEAASDEKAIVTAVTTYYSEYGKYPVDPATKPGDAEYSTDNNALFDVLRNMTGPAIGNAMNSRGVVFLSPHAASNQNAPADGILASTGVWYDPWGSPYNVAIDGNYDGQLNSPTPLPNFYTDVGPLQLGVIVWSFGKNGQLGGGPAVNSGFSNESGTTGVLNGSSDVHSW